MEKELTEDQKAFMDAVRGIVHDKNCAWRFPGNASLAEAAGRAGLTQERTHALALQCRRLGLIIVSRTRHNEFYYLV